MTNQTPDFERSWRQRFESYAEAHDDDAHIAGWSESGLAARVKCFRRAWSRAPESSVRGGRWLDAGAGAGTYTRYLMADGRPITAIDYSIPTVRKAKQRSTGGVDWVAADVTRLPFADSTFDGALCFGVMQALSSPQEALRELKRVLVPGGVLWVDALNGQCFAAKWSVSQNRRRRLPDRLRYDDPEEFKRALRDNGFGAIEVNWSPIVPNRLRVLQPLVDASVAAGMLNAIPPLAAGVSHSILLRAQAS